ncbi:hypothetical protein [Paenibacillus arenosi]|uniref:Uncharacterized protein n=1 Tax=Paenibacillus arenosi TaxID=2774142 RepID=A0ABR9AXQ1_9BACL|nr:hypothetical protein [Paenibacillus arenosi]MBD8498869.1 hypothetical protein [Paenibacillus arenosi]
MKHGTRLWGSVHLPQVKLVEKGISDIFRITTDGVDYEIVLDAKEYVTSHELFTTDLVSQINKKLRDAGAPVQSRLGGIHKDSPFLTVLILEHVTANSSSVITQVSGTAADLLFGQVSMIEEARP